MPQNFSDTSGESKVCEILPEKVDIPPFTMVIFGGTGDLSRRKLLPTLYHLCDDQNLPEQFEHTLLVEQPLLSLVDALVLHGFLPI